MKSFQNVFFIYLGIITTGGQWKQSVIAEQEDTEED